MDTVDRYGLEASFSFSVDKEVKTSVNSAIDDIERLKKALNGIQGMPSKMANPFDKLGGKAVQQPIQKSVDALKHLKAEFKTLSAETRNIDFGDLDDPHAFKAAKQGVEQYIQELERLKSSIKGNTLAERDFKASLEAQQKVAARRIDVASGQVDMIAQQQQLAHAADLAGKFQQVKDIGRSMTGFFDEPIASSREFQGELGGINKLAGLDEKNLAKLSKGIFTIAGATGAARSEVSGVLENMASGGKSFDNLEAIQTEAKAIIQLHQALDISADSAGGLDTILSGTFTETNKKTGGVVSNLMRVGGAINGLADNLENVQISGEQVTNTLTLVAKQNGDKANFKLPEMAAYSAVTSSMGAAPSVAAGLLQSIETKSSSKQSEWAQVLHISTQELNRLKNEDEYGLITKLAHSIHDFKGTEAQKSAMFERLGLTDQTSQGYVKQMAANPDLLDKAQIVANDNYWKNTQNNSITNELGKQGDSADFQADRFASSMKNLQTTMGNAINLALTPMKRNFSDLIGKVIAFTQEQPELIKYVTLGAYVLGTAATAVGTLAGGFWAIRMASGEASMAMKLMQKGVMPLTGFFETATTAISSQGLLGGITALGSSITTFATGALAFLSSPIVLITAGLVGLYAVIEYLTPGINILGTVLSALAAPIGFVSGVIKGFVTTLVSGLGDRLGGVSINLEALSPVMAFLGETVKMVSDTFMKFFGIGETSGAGFATAILGIIDVVSATFRTFMGTIDFTLIKPIQFVMGLWQQVFSYLSPIVTSGITSVIAAMQPLQGVSVFVFTLIENLKQIFAPVSEIMSNPFQLGAFSIDTIWQGLGDRIVAIFGALQVKAGEVGGYILGVWQGSFGALGGIVAEGFAAVTLAVEPFANIPIFISGIVENIKGIVSTIGSFITAPFQTATTTINGLWENTGGKIASMFGLLRDKSAETGNDLVGNLAEHSPGTTWLIRQKWGLTTETIAGGLDKLVTFGKNTGKALAKSVVIPPLNKIKLPNLSNLPTLPPASNPVAGVSQAVGGLGIQLPVQVTGLADSLSQAIEAVSPKIAALRGGLRDATISIKGFVYSLPTNNPVRQALTFLDNGFNSISLQIKMATNGMFTFVASGLIAIAPLALAFIGLGLVIGGAMFNLLGLRDIVTGIGKAVWGILTAVTGVATGSIQIIQGILGFIGAIPAAITGDFTAMGESLGTIWNGISTVFSSVFQGFIGVVEGVTQTIQGVFTGIGQLFQGTVFGDGINFLVQLLESARQVVRDFGDSVISTFVETGNNLTTGWNFISEGITSVFNHALGAVDTVIKSVKSVFINFGNFFETGLVGGWLGYLGEVLNSAKNAIAEFVSGISGLLTRPLEAIGNTVDKVKSSLGIKKKEPIIPAQETTTAPMPTGLEAATAEPVKEKRGFFGFGKKKAVAPTVVPEVMPMQVVEPTPVAQAIEQMVQPTIAQTPPPVPQDIVIKTPALPMAAALAPTESIGRINPMALPTETGQPKLLGEQAGLRAQLPQAPVVNLGQEGVKKDRPMNMNQHIDHILQQKAAFEADVAQGRLSPKEITQGRENAAAYHDHLASSGKLSGRQSSKLSQLKDAAPDITPKMPTADPLEAIGDKAQTTVGKVSGAVGNLGTILNAIAPQLAAPVNALGSLLATGSAVGSAFSGLLPILTGIFPALAPLIPAITGMGASFMALIPGIGGTAIATEGLTVASFSLDAALTPILAALSPIIGIVAAVAGALLLLKIAFDNNFMGLKDGVDFVVNGISGAFSWLQGIFSGAIGWIGSKLMEAGNFLKSTVGTMLQPIFDTFSTVFAQIGVILKPLFNLFDQLKPALMALGGFIFDKMLTPLKIAGAVIAVPFLALFGILKGLAFVLQPIISFIGFIGSGIISSLVAPIQFVMSLVGLVQAGFSAMAAAIAAPFQFVSDVVNGVIGFLTSIPSMIGTLFSGLMSALPTPIQWLLNTLMGNSAATGNSGAGGVPSDIPQFATGGFNANEGLAYLHPNEFVVNSAATAGNMDALTQLNDTGVLPQALAPVPIPVPSFGLPSLFPSATPAVATGDAGVTVYLTVGDVVIQNATDGVQAAREFLDSIEPQLNRAIRDGLRKMTELTK